MSKSSRVAGASRVPPRLACFVVLSLLSATSASFSKDVTPSSISIPKGGLIATEGDSLTYGMDVSPAGVQTQINGAPQTRSTSPYPETLAEQLHGCAQVSNLGYPGDRSVDGLVRWQASKPANLAILMYGSNDALNNGHAATGPINVETFKSVLTILVQRRLQAGSKVLLLSPPPIGNAHQEKLIDPYREAVKETASELGVSFLNTEPILNSISPLWTEDKVHLSPAANIALATNIGRLIECQ